MRCARASGGANTTKEVTYAQLHRLSGSQGTASVMSLLVLCCDVSRGVCMHYLRVEAAQASRGVFGVQICACHASVCMERRKGPEESRVSVKPRQTREYIDVQLSEQVA